jgi:hypothetical protein
MIGPNSAREELFDHTILHTRDGDPTLILSDLKSEEAWREPPEHVQLPLIEGDIDVPSKQSMMANAP